MPLSTSCAVQFRRVRFAAFAGAAATLLCAAPCARAVNVAPEGAGLIGLNTGVHASLGTPYAHFNAPGTLKDRDLTTHEDTWNDAGATTHSYVGILFAAPRADWVTSVSLNMAVFFDGGWFGPNGVGPGASGALAANHLTAPTVQITLDEGQTWQMVPDANDYVSRLTGTTLPAAFGPPTAAPAATFNLVTPVTGIRGIRLIGPEGGTASGGFIGVFEIGVDAAVPEPASLGALGLVGILALRRPRA